MLLLLMMRPLLPVAVVVVEPVHPTPAVGKFAPAGPMLLFEIVLLSLPFAVTASVLKNTVPPADALADVFLAPWRSHFVMVLFVAPLINRIVLVPVPPIVRFDIVRELPPVLSPLIVTLSAPLRSIVGLPAVVAPEIVR